MKQTPFIFILFMLLFAGCSQSERDNDDTTVSSYEYARAQNAFFDVWKVLHGTIVRDTVLGNQATTISPDICIDTVMRTPNLGPYPITLTLDFGSGELCSDGRIRKGKIIATLSGQYGDSNTTMSVSFEEYQMNDLAFQGNMKVGFLGDSALLPRFYQRIDSARLVRDLPGNQRQDTWIEKITQRGYWGSGKDTFGNPNDDEFRFTSGAMSGRNTYGVFFTAQTTQTIITRFDCTHESGGMVTIEQSNRATRYLDFEGGCDDKVAVTYYNTTEYLTIP